MFFYIFEVVFGGVVSAQFSRVVILSFVTWGRGGIIFALFAFVACEKDEEKAYNKKVD